jgi:hypothetical protein
MIPAGFFSDPETGEPLGEHLYTNTDKTWEWLQEKAAKAARYLGYLPWMARQITQQSVGGKKNPRGRISSGAGFQQAKP